MRLRGEKEEEEEKEKEREEKEGSRELRFFSGASIPFFPFSEPGFNFP